MLLYVHVPFCSRKCNYCAFHSTVPGPEDMPLYVEALLAEIAFWKERLEEPKIDSLYFGGGTPSLIPLQALASIVKAIESAFEFEAGLEFSFEANPDSVVRFGYLHGLKAVGVNRLSLGVQSLYDRHLRTLGRVHDSEQALGAYYLARDAGFDNINLDLIWGLPGLRLSTWMTQLREVVRLKPNHLSCYGLTLEPDTPLEKQCREKDMDFAPEKDLAKMFIHGAEYLEAQGFLQYEISNFAAMGFQCRHNLGYWEGRDYLGLGPSAVSTINGKRWQNPKDLAEYAAYVQEGKLGQDPEVLDLSVRVKERVMLSLRTTRGLRLGEYSELTGRSFFKDFGQMVQALRQHELVRISKGYLWLTKTGMLVSDAILANFFADEE